MKNNIIFKSFSCTQNANLYSTNIWWKSQVLKYLRVFSFELHQKNNFGIVKNYCIKIPVFLFFSFFCYPGILIKVLGIFNFDLFKIPIPHQNFYQKPPSKWEIEVFSSILIIVHAYKR